MKITETERLVLAAYFARSNMGLGRATRKEIKRLINGDGYGYSSVTLPSAVLSLSQQFLETDEQYQMFLGEARMWASRRYFGRKYSTREAILKNWPHVKEAFWPDGENQMSDKNTIVAHTSATKKTIAGFKRLADEMEGLLEHLEDSTDSINITIVKENQSGHKITLTIIKPEPTTTKPEPNPNDGESDGV